MSITKLKLREESYSFSPKYIISDEHDNTLAVANKHIFSWSKRATLQSPAGGEILIIKGSPFSFRANYSIEMDGEPIFNVWSNLGLKTKVEVESLIDSDHYVIQGNIWSSEYAFYRNGNEFAYVSRKIWSMEDTYGIAIIEEFDLHLMIALVIVIDLIKDRRDG